MLGKPLDSTIFGSVEAFWNKIHQSISSAIFGNFLLHFFSVENSFFAVHTWPHHLRASSLFCLQSSLFGNQDEILKNEVKCLNGTIFFRRESVNDGGLKYGILCAVFLRLRLVLFCHFPSALNF